MVPSTFEYIQISINLIHWLLPTVFQWCLYFQSRKAENDAHKFSEL